MPSSIYKTLHRVYDSPPEEAEDDGGVRLQERRAKEAEFLSLIF